MLSLEGHNKHQNHPLVVSCEAQLVGAVSGAFKGAAVYVSSPSQRVCPDKQLTFQL